MAVLKYAVVLFVLCSVITSSLCQVSQGGPYETQGGAHVPQGGPHETQDGAHLDPLVRSSQGRVRRQAFQGGPHQSQGRPHESQGGPHQNQGRVRRQVDQGANQGLPVWTSCDFSAVSKISCHDCKTRLICKKFGGILKPCGPKKPFCNNGVCSVEPSPECA